MTNPDEFDAFMEAMYVDLMRAAPEFAALMGVLQVGDAVCPLDRFSSVSDEAGTDRQRLLGAIARQLGAFPRASLSVAQRVSADVLDYFLNFAWDGPWIGLQGSDFARHSYLVNPGQGEPGRLLDALTQQHPFRHEQDAENYLSRVDAFADAMTEVGSQVHLRHRRGILLPAPLLRQSIDEIRALLALAPAANPIYETFAMKSVSIGGPQVRRERWLERLQESIRRRVLPSYAGLAEILEGLVDGARAEGGMWQMPHGDAYYEFLLQAATTTRMSSSAVHELGIEQVEQVREQIRSALRDAALPDGDMIGTLRQLESQTRFAPSVTRPALLERCESILHGVHERLPDLFHRLPAAAVTTEAVPAFSEDARHTSYQPSAVDGSRPARLVINLKDVAAESELDLPTLLYHEVYPGHHLQLSYAQQLEGLPTFRRAVTFDAYIEGWAKYAETIPWEHGINRDPRWHAMRLRRELLSTANLVLDTGIHSKRWTLHEAGAYLRATTGCSAAMSRAIALRSASIPAQLCSYKIGMLQVTELKNRFERARGATFDIRDFHTAVLGNGAVPLRVLQSLIESALAQA